MEEELVPLFTKVVDLIGIYAIVIVFWMLSKYVNIIVTYIKDMKIAKMTMKRPEDMETVIVHMLTPETNKKTFFNSLKEKWSKRKKEKLEKEMYGRLEQNKL